MTLFEFIQLAIVVGTGIMGWFMRVLFGHIERLENTDNTLMQSLTDIKVALPTHYVSKSDFQTMGDNIFQTLRRIEDKLDTKVDRRDTP